MKAVWVNGQITEVKQPRPWLILRWGTIWHPCILSFFSVWLQLAETLGKLGKFARSTGILKILNWDPYSTLIACCSVLTFLYRLTEQVDEFTSLHVTLTYLVNIVGHCLILYILIWEYDTLQNDIVLLGRTAFWLLVVSFSLFGELIIGARINSMVGHYKFVS